jgi:hypothetical protein
MELNAFCLVCESWSIERKQDAIYSRRRLSNSEYPRPSEQLWAPVSQCCGVYTTVHYRINCAVCPEGAQHLTEFPYTVCQLRQ